ncbi:MAG: hypothetical protein JO166_15920 [Deltaproteobacteria bacterium]|nr:hypothetical protein [Deltaproteobacteria bacterium]
MAHDDVMVGQTVEGHADAKITSVTGRIDIGQGLRNGATATLIATNGSITIDGAVDQTSIVNWSARVFNCLRQDGTIKRLRPLEQD